MANVLEFVKKNLTRVVVIGVAAACVLGAGIVLIADRVAYANYEANYEKEAEELRATFPALPKSVIMDDNYVTFSADGSEVASTKSPYKKSFIYYARDAVIAPLNQNVAVEYERTDDTLLGEYMTGLDRKGGAITFTVQPQNPSHPRLRSGLKTEVYVITSIRDDVLRIRNGSFYAGPGKYTLFIFKDDRTLVPREVQLGECNYDYIEVISGLSEGEELVVSDMAKYKGKEKLRVRN